MYNGKQEKLVGGLHTHRRMRNWSDVIVRKEWFTTEIRDKLRGREQAVELGAQEKRNSVRRLF